MTKKWYMKSIAMFLAAALAVSSAEPAVAMAENDTAVQDEIPAEVEEILPEEALVTDNQTDEEPVLPAASEADTAAEDVTVMIGETGYASLGEAVAAAQAGDVITLKQDLELGSCLEIQKNLTITADEENRTIRRQAGFLDTLIKISSGAVLTFGSGAEAGKLILDGGAEWVKDIEVEDPAEPTGKRTETVTAEGPAEEGAYNRKESSNGSMIWVQNGQLELQKDGILRNNDLLGNGAAVAASGGGSSRIHVRGTIQNNHASDSGAAIRTNGYTDIYETAVVQGNAAGNMGGAVDNWSGGVMTVRGGTFTGNKADKGGAVSTDGKMEITSGFMNGNSARLGGAVYVLSANSGRSALFNGGTIKENKAEQGADVYLSTQHAKFRGNVEIGEVHLPQNFYMKISGALSGSIGLTMAQTPEQGEVLAARGEGYTLTEADGGHIYAVSELYKTNYKEQAVYLNYSPVIIDQQPQSLEDRAEIGDRVTFKVDAHAAAGTEVSYQWYECSDSTGNDATELDGKTDSTLSLSKDTPGIYYFYCVLSAPEATDSRTEVVSVKFIDSSSAEVPVITSQPEDLVLDLQKEGTLHVEAAVEDAGTLSYQWYRQGELEAEEGQMIEGANEASYQVPTEESGYFYYYCVVTNTNTSVTNQTSSKKSRTVTVQVTEAAVRYNGKGYSSLEDALAQVDGETGGTLEILKDVTMSRTVTLSGGDLRVTAAEGTSPVIQLTNGLTGEAFLVHSGTLTLEQVTLDGGAIWTGTVHEILQRGISNRGREVNKPIITMTGGTVNLGEGTILQNNVAPWTSAGVVMSSGTLNINGAQIIDCYGGSHGGVIYANSANCEIVMTEGKILRNQARSSTGAICADLGTKLSISGGEIAHNYTVGRAGAVFVNGTLNISGNTDIHDNYAGGNGGGVLHLEGTFRMDGGMIRNNISKSNGGGVASLHGTVTLNEGIISGNTASSNGNGIYMESGVTVTSHQIPAEVTDTVYSARTLSMTLNGNGFGQTSSQTIRYLSFYELPELQRNGYQFLGWYTQAVGGEKIQTGDRIRTTAAHTLYAHWLLTATNVITIAKQPEGGALYIEDTPKLKVEASAASGGLNYQWYRCEDATGSNSSMVGENSPELSLPSQEEAMGTYYYYCLISAAEQNAEDVRTETVKVELISKNQASVPVFTTEPEHGEFFVGEEMELSAQAVVSDEGSISYQWYKGSTEHAEEAEKIPGATESSYTVRATEAGISYYFVKAINKKENSFEEEIWSETFSRGAQIIIHERIQAEQVTASHPTVSQSYWETYRVGTQQNPDGYISGFSSMYGSYGTNYLTNAFDGRFNTFWETNRGGVVNQVEMNFSKEVKLDRIAYATRQDGYAGRGYPTKLTVFSKNSEGEWLEIGVAVSDVSNGYMLFTFPETVVSAGLRLEFTESTFNNWASASEIILLRDEDTVLTGSAQIKGNAVAGSSLTVQPEIIIGPGAGVFKETQPELLQDPQNARELLEKRLRNLKSDTKAQVLDSALTYQWQRSSDGVIYTDIEGAQNAAYSVTEADREQYLRVVIKESTGAFSGSIVSEPYRGSFQVEVKGDAKVGAKLTPEMLYMTGEEVTYQYQWQRTDAEENFADIPNAVHETYQVQAADAGEKVRVKVSVGDYAVYSEEVSIAVSAILTGAPQTGSTLQLSLEGVVEEADLDLTYAWQISSENTEGSFQTIVDASGDAYTIPEGMEGSYIRGVITVNASGNQYVSDAWKILAEGTIQDCEKDYVYLSDLPREKMPVGTVGFGSLQYDKNTSGGRISLLVDGQKNYFMKGFGAHANATLIFDVSDYVTYYHYDRFIAYLGVDSGQAANGNGVTFQIQTSVDGQQFTTVKSTGVLKGTSNAVLVDLDLNGANYLKIYIDINGNPASDHSVVADAKLAHKSYQNGSETTDLFQTVEAYDAQIKAYEEGYTGTYEELLKDDEYRKLVYQRTFVKAADYQLLKAYLYDESYVDTLRWFLNDLDALDLYMGGGAPEGSYANFVEALKNLYLANGSDMEDSTNGPLYKKMIITTALTHSATVTYWADSSVKSDAVRRYQIYKKLYDYGLLLNDVFANLSVEEMRWVFNNISADEEIEWLNYYVRYHTNKKDLAANNQLNLSNFTPGPYYFITYTMGFNYYQERFYSESNKSDWQKKYSLTNETADPRVEPYDLNITYATNKPRLWIVWEAGAVCGGISKTGTNLLTAFGVPGVVVGQPGHAAYFQYGETADGKGKWDIYNDISGWVQTEKGERMLNGWGNQRWKSYYNGSYLLLAQAAINEEEKYFKSQELVKLADVYSDDADKQIEIYEEALKILDLNLDAWERLFYAYQKAGKGSEDMLKLAERISKALTYYPLPMRDILMNLIQPQLQTESEKALVAIYVQSALNKAKVATEQNTLQPKYCITMANHLLGNTDYQVASFSFSGEKAGKVVLNDSFSGGNELLLSIDGGNNWINAGTVTEYTFSEKEVEQITAEHDILVRLQGTESYYTIDITQGSKPTKIYNNDLENRMTGNVSGLEWKYEDGAWKDMKSEELFEGDQTILVRTKAAGTATASEADTYSFTADAENPARKYIPLRNITLTDYSSDQPDKNGAVGNILDGNRYTWWHTLWNGSDQQRYLTVKFDEARYLTSIDYLPSGGNGTFQNVEIYTSMDGDTWILSGDVSGLANNTTKKTIDLYGPVYTTYVKIKVTKGVNGFASGAMLEFFEDTTVENKTVASLELLASPAKTSYMRGDELDPAGLSVRAHYSDGTYSSTNPELLQFTPSVFREIGTQNVEIGYRLDAQIHPVSFTVTVEENTKTAERIEIAREPDKIRYFVGDALDLTGLEIKAHYTDGSKGYLFDDQYQVTPKILTEDGKEIPITVSYQQGEQTLTTEFPVEVTKQVKELKVTQKPEKDSYNLADGLEAEGLEITVVYTDDTEEVLDSMEYTVETQGFSDQSGLRKLGVFYNRIPEIRTEFEVLVYPYITDGYLRLESEDNTDTAYVNGVTEQGIPENGKVVIPSHVTVADRLQFTVTKIASGAFAENTEVKAAVLPGTIQYMESGAFTGCAGLKEVYLTEHTDFAEFQVADDAFGPVDEEGAIYGTIYVADAALADQLRNRNLKGLENFVIIPVTDKLTALKVTAPDKSKYHLGEELDLAGLAVTGSLENGEKLELSENLYQISAFDPNRAGEQILTVTGKGTDLSDSFTVTVTPATPVIEHQPQSKVYDMSEFPQPLQMEASISDAGHLQYQWYSSTDGGKFEKLSAETGTSCAVVPKETRSYYVEVTNNDAAGDPNTAVTVQSEVVTITFGNYEARVNGTAYETLDAAVAAAKETSNATVTLIKNILLDRAITLSSDVTLEGYGIYRKTGYTNGPLLKVTGGKTTLKNLVVDGGAVWSGNVDSILNRGTTNSGTNEVTGQSAIRASHTLAEISGGELRLETGASLQNNVNNGSYGTNGGAARVIGSGVLRIVGGQILNNYSSPYGGAVLSIETSKVILEKGRVAGNQAPDSGGTFCVDGSSTFTMNDSGDETFPSIIEDNRGNANGGVIWLSNGSASLNGGIIRNNRANGSGGVVYISGSGTVNLGTVQTAGNQAGGTGAGIHVNSGSLNITGAPDMTEGIYLPNNKLIRVKSDLSSVSRKIPVTVQFYQSSGGRFGTADSPELAKAAVNAFQITGGTLPVYAKNGELYYGNPTTITLTTDLPEAAEIMAGRQLTLSVEAAIDPADAGELNYRWYRCLDAQGGGATLITTSESDQPNILSLGDCTEGVYYFYCEVSDAGQKAEIVRSTICTVNVTKFIPASKAIEKMNQL